jgi:FtsZ-binding cell division protein ZapB
MTESFEDAIKALRHIARGNGSVLRIADRIVAAHERETKVEGVCGPITGELRGAMHPWGWVESDGSITFATSPTPSSIDAEQSLAISSTDFTQLCDAIDSIHATLEYEYDELRMKYVNINRHAQHVERENESLKAELDRVMREQDRDGWIELPKDADGVPIRVGDTVEYVDDTLAPRNVTSINLAGDGWWVYTNGFGRRPDKCRHVTPDTWEQIIEDALDGYHDTDFEKLVARCKKLAGDAE